MSNQTFGLDPAGITSASTTGWRDTVGENAAEQVRYDAGTWTLRVRLTKTGQTIATDITVRVVVIVYRVTSAGAHVAEMGRVQMADSTLSTTTLTLTGSFTTAGTTTFNAGDKFQVDAYVTPILASIPAAPAAAVNVNFILDETSANSGAAFTAIPGYQILYARALSVSVVWTAALARLLTLSKSYSVNQNRTVTLVRVLAFARSFTVDANRTVTALRVASLLRSHSVNLTRTVAATRLLTLARSYSVNLARTVAAERLLSLLRSFTVNQARTVGFARAVISARAFSVNVVRTVSMRIEMPQAVLNRMTPGGGGSTTIIRRTIRIFED